MRGLLFLAIAFPDYARAEERRILVDDYRDKMAAGWIGQMAGVGWGAPTEFRYKGVIIPEDKVPNWTPERINQYNQDDIYVEMTFLRSMEEHGFDVSIRQAGIDFANSGYRLWHANKFGRDNLRAGIAPPDSGHPKFSAHSDDIDYQIEADYAGLISPGMPDVGIALGEKFGRLMNYGDGLYGGQFVAGMYAEAFFEDDVRKIVEAGLACIPAESQYAETIRDVIAWHEEEPDDWQATWKRINDKYHLDMEKRPFTCKADGDFNIDAGINGAFIVMGLLYGERDLDKTIVVSMRCGQDSDCNPSNAAGILFTTIGREELPPRFVSALDTKPKFSHTAYDFNGLLNVCEDLTRQAVERSGGRIDKDAKGVETFVIPVADPKPSPLEKSHEPGPIANSRFTEDEMKQIDPPPEPQKRKAASQKVDISKVVAAFAPGWTIKNCGSAMSPGLRKDWGGRKNVLMTHPLNQKTPCVLSRSVELSEGKPASLELGVRNDNRGDFDLVVRVGKKELLRETIAGDKWREISIDLSQFAGKTIDLEILNIATEWKFEGAYWSKIMIKREIENAWVPLRGRLNGGLLSERVDVWREGRLVHMIDAEDDYLLSGFESRPGRHPWQGEHVGKWLHAATLAQQQTGDKKLLKAIETAVERLLASQDENGYMGTYAPHATFMAAPENVSLAAVADDIEPAKKPKRKRRPSGGWDTWTLRYNIYGLLTYERFHPDRRVVEACAKMGDLLIESYGPGKHDLTQYGTRKGISATTLLESIVMLYERTGEQKYLDFAEHIVAMSEANPGLRLMGAALEGSTLTKPGEGKAYQMMANLLGYARLYSCTGNDRYLATAEKAWDAILSLHTYTTGGPWSRKMSYNGNTECFALLEDFSPEDAKVETCSTTTWIQLNVLLLEMTGEAKYAAEAERSFYNGLLAAQADEGIAWCYFTKANCPSQPFQEKITCCASSGPRAIEEIAAHMIGEVDGGVSFASLAPCRVTMGKAEIEVTGDYPISPSAEIRFKKANGQSFAIEFCEPTGASLASIEVNGKPAKANKNDRGFYRLDGSWKKGDTIAIAFDYELNSHIVRATEDKHWVAFTYGPWALAREGGKDFAEPFVGKSISEGDASQWLEATGHDTPTTVRVKGTDLVLQPYYRAGSPDSGPRTYFTLLASAAPGAE